jgi:murein DD-endopeptidase MepM/ murein hydrolase activator NlpD
MCIAVRGTGSIAGVIDGVMVYWIDSSKSTMMDEVTGEIMNIHVKDACGSYGKYILLLIVSALMIFTSPAESTAADPGAKLSVLCNEFNVLNTAIRDSTMKKPAAKVQFRNLLENVRKEYYASRGGDYPASTWVFPLQGYGYDAIGGVGGSGYQTGGYNYFDGNSHSGHPSHDIFIHDRKQVSLDNGTGKPVHVLSVTGGVVVAEAKEWDPKSSLRGGKYIWIYDPTSNALVYYAHNSALHVNVGDLVKPGDIIADVGRTGLNAYKKRSPSHLHLTYLSIVNGLPVPKNIYRELLSCRLL